LLYTPEKKSKEFRPKILVVSLPKNKIKVLSWRAFHFEIICSGRYYMNQEVNLQRRDFFSQKIGARLLRRRYDGIAGSNAFNPAPFLAVESSEVEQYR